MGLGTTSERIAYANSRLNSAYTHGSIVYPRTEYNYDTYKEFDFYPHPKINEFDEFALPLKFKRYPFIKDAIPVELSNHRIATAATLQNTISWLDGFYDDNLRPLSAVAEREINIKLDKFYDHLEYLDKTYKTKTIRTEDGSFDIDKISKDGYVARMKMEIMPFRIPLHPTPQLLAEVKKAKADTRKKKRSQDVKSFTKIESKFLEVSTIDHALSLFQKRNLGVFYLRKKAEQMMRENFVLKEEQFVEETLKSLSATK